MGTKQTAIITKELDFSLITEDFYIALLNDILQYKKTKEVKNELSKN